MMRNGFRFDELEELIVRDEKLFFTIVSYAAVLIIFLNLSAIQSPVVGAIVSIIYFLINGLFLGHAFIEKEEAFLKLLLGNLFLIMLLGFVGWMVMIIHNLDVIRSTIVLCIVTALSSFLNRRMKHKNAAQ